MYDYAQNKDPKRPVALTGGVAAALIGLLAAGLEGYMWIRVYNALTELLPDEASANADAQQTISIYSGFLIVIVIASVLISLAVIFGALFALRGSNSGRITMWIAGGLAIAWHACCSGYTLLIRAVFAQAIAETNNDGYDANDVNVAEHFSMWMVDAAVIAGTVVGVASLAVVIMISLGPVNRYFRAMKQPPTMPGAPRW